MKIYVDRLLLVLIAIIMSGCATHAQRQESMMIEQFEKASTNHELCFKEIKKNTSVKFVYENILIEEDNSKNKYDLLSSKQKINDEMKPHFMMFLNMSNECRKAFLADISNIHQTLATAYGSQIRNIDILFGGLISGEIAIGEFNQQIQSSKSSFAREWNLSVKNIVLELSDRHYKEMVLRQSAIRALTAPSSHSYTPRSTTTNCNLVGQSLVTCNSY